MVLHIGKRQLGLALATYDSNMKNRYISHQEMLHDPKRYGHVHSMETRDCHVGSVNETQRTVGIHESADIYQTEIAQ